LESDSEETILSDSDSGHNEDAATVGWNNNANGSQVHIWSNHNTPGILVITTIVLEVPVDWRYKRHLI